MKYQLVIGHLIFCVASVCSAAEWKGTMSCGELHSSNNQRSTTPFKHDVTLTIEGGRASLDRAWSTGKEHIQGTAESGQQLRLEGQGWFFGNEVNAWKTRAVLVQSGVRYEGTATIESQDSKKKYRDCSVTLQAMAGTSLKNAERQPKISPATASKVISPQQKADLGGTVFACINGTNASKLSFLNDGRFLDTGFLMTDGKYTPFSWIVGNFSKTDNLIVRKNRITADSKFSLQNGRLTRTMQWKKIDTNVEIRDRFVRQVDGTISLENIATLNDGKNIGPQGTAVCQDETSASMISDAQDLINTAQASLQQSQPATASTRSDPSYGLCTKTSDRDDAKRQTIAARQAVLVAISRAEEKAARCSSLSRSSVQPMVSQADKGLNNLLELYDKRGGLDASLWYPYCLQYVNAAKLFTGECK